MKNERRELRTSPLSSASGFFACHNDIYKVSLYSTNPLSKASLNHFKKQRTDIKTIILSKQSLLCFHLEKMNTISSLYRYYPELLTAW